MYGGKLSFRTRKSPKQRDRCWPQIIFVPNQRQAFEWVLEPYFLRVASKGLCRPSLKTFAAENPYRLTAPGSPTMLVAGNEIPTLEDLTVLADSNILNQLK